MCGISGIISFERSEFNLLKLTESMNNSIRHRGPDDEGFAIFENDNYFSAGSVDTKSSVWNTQYPYTPRHQVKDLSIVNPKVVLGHRRLSIIDLSPAGHQPMCDPEGRYWIVFNGAIYNFEELKSDLKKLGHQFFSHTDTEILLHAYIAWGRECVGKFIGMWAFVIYDRVQQSFFASRDRIGVKPFYYCYNEKYFAFASEIKALTTLPFIYKQLNDTAIYDYLVLGKCEEEEESIFKNIFELPPANNIELNIHSGKMQKSCYYRPSFSNAWEAWDESKNGQYVSDLQELLRDSVHMHLRTDAKVGACLSGGLDSSIISGLVSMEMQNLPVFTVTSNGDDEDESRWAKIIVDKFKLKWHTINPHPLDLLNNFENFMYCQDLPCISANAYSHFKLMKLVNQEGVKVTIDGQGADELFAGYGKFYPTFLMEAFSNGSLRTIIQAIQEPGNDFARKKSALFSPFKMAVANRIGPGLTSKVFRNKYQEFSFIKADFWDSYSQRLSLQNKIHSDLNSSLFYDFHGNSLKTMLRVGDRNSMRFGIETRVPFSDDYRLEQFAFKVPSVYKVRNNYGKALLRQAAQPWLPREICYRKDKKGFSIPEKRWLLEMGEDVFPYFDEYLTPYVNIDLLKKDWMNTLKHTHSTVRMWRLLCFAVWMKTWNHS